jgi:hypothetical protein
MRRSSHLKRSLGGLLLAGALLAGCGGGDGGQTNVAASGTDANASEAPKSTGTGPTEADLRPVGGSKASGTVLYKKTPSGMPLLKIRLTGLVPTTREEKYVIWQAGSPHDMVPLATYVVKGNGELNENLKAGFESLAFLEDGSRTEMIVSKVGDDDPWREGLGQGGQGPYDPAVKGQFVLRGPITGSLVGGGE